MEVVKNVAVKDSKKLKAFFENSGIKVFKKYTQNNILVLKKINGEQIEILAEIDNLYLPYMFIEE